MRPKKITSWHKLATFFEIPQDIVLDLPRITMLGNKQLLVENHKGIIEYTGQIVRIRLNEGELTICGAGMMLGNLQYEQILIEGTIKEVKYDF